jgi:DNA-binding IclR family transcriptional regulator
MSERDGQIQVIDRAAILLRALAAAGEAGLPLSALAEATGLSTTTCHRILASLAQNGLVARGPAGRRYTLGLQFFRLGHQAAEGTGMRALFRSVLTRLCAETGDTVFLMVRSGFQSVCVDRRDGTTMIPTVTGGIGGVAPLGIGPGSQAILAFLGPEETASILQHNTALFDGFQNHSFKVVEEALRETRRLGYAQDLGAVIPGVSGVAVPIRIAGQGDAIASLGLGLLSARLDSKRLAHLVGRLQAEVAGLEAQLNPLAPWFGRDGDAVPRGRTD